MSVGIDSDELSALALQLFRQRLGLDGKGKDDEARSLELAIAEAKLRAELWLGVLDRVERVVERVLDRIDQRALGEAARKSLPPKSEPKPDEEPDVTPLLEALGKRPAVEEAAALLKSWGATADNIDAFVETVRASAPEWAAFLDENPEWTSGVLEAIKGGGSEGGG